MNKLEKTICPKCYYEQTEEGKKLSPLSCPVCGCLYQARDFINEKKRQENERLKAWRITRWRPKYKTSSLVFGVPTVMLVMYLVYQLGLFVIANSRPISNEIYRATNTEAVSEAKTTAPPQISPPPVQQAFLTVTTSKPLTLWLENQKTREKYGPYKLKGNDTKRLPLTNGKYTIKVVREGKIEITETTHALKEGLLPL